MRPKCHKDRGQARRVGALVQVPQNVAVAEMHAVERANRDDRTAGKLRKARGVTHRASTRAGRSSSAARSATAMSVSS